MTVRRIRGILRSKLAFEGTNTRAIRRQGEFSTGQPGGVRGEELQGWASAEGDSDPVSRTRMTNWDCLAVGGGRNTRI